MANLLTDIALAATEIMTLVIGAAGLGLALLLLFCPDKVRRLGDTLNRSLTPIRLSPFLDRRIEANRLAYRHPFFIGSFFLIGSLFVLHFLFLQIAPATYENLGTAIVWEFMTAIGRVAGFCGVILGVSLIAFPDRVRALEDRLGAWIDTEPLAKGLDRPRPYMDHIVLRYPLTSGAVTLLASFVLTILSIYNLTR